MYKLLRNFFWFCSGANKRLLEENDIDHNKYFAIGATIFFTAIFAGFSGGYAMYFVFSGSEYAVSLAIALGVLWGLTIFNIDRFLVMSIKKENNFFKEFFFALPRIVLAIMIGVVIARPLELRIFEKEINEGLKQFYLENQQEIIGTKLTNFQAEIKEDVDKLNRKRIERDNADTDYRNHIKLRDTEYYGDKTGSTTGIPGWGPHAKKRQEEVDAKKVVLDNLTKKIEELENEINTKRANAGLDNVANYDNKTLDSLVSKSGFYDRNKILGQISSWTPFSSSDTKVNTENISQGSSLEVRKTKNRFSGEDDPTVFFISLLFIIIETLPILVKLLTKRSTYDMVLEHEEERIDFTKRHETTSHKQLIRNMSVSQRAVLNEAINKWEANELESDTLNERYINTDNEDHYA
ncbi:DUF4407 domain-containing protein [Kordia sp. YSTF-M3]|uniref:DUF4407 domain-containing protein n=1 Tax=Kordia aestuariivivens TaxID=2759037 RepID=A0ABR7QCC5_9FLAO|nr:DUF4407 domain-containing protein [Kordia aestuariivivens]MBC8755989.1 DUF4407 domain-containing protein [Kordia aestuariivivens]